jgi:tetratricopeptide (TPR) repeat protein
VGSDNAKTDANYYEDLRRKESALKASSSIKNDFETRKEYALTLWQSGKLDEAAKQLKDLWLEAAARQRSGCDEEFVSVARALSNVYQDMGGFDSAGKCYQSILEYELPRMPSDDPRLATEYNNIGLCHYLQAEATDAKIDRAREFNLALTSFRQAEKIWKLHQTRRQDIMLNLHNQLVVLSELGDESSARFTKQQIQALASKVN